VLSNTQIARLRAKGSSLQLDSSADPVRFHSFYRSPNHRRPKLPIGKLQLLCSLFTETMLRSVV
jgi:hypothetical protein